MREATWLRVIERATEEGLQGLIFMFTPERTVRPDFVGAVVTSVGNKGGKVLFVELACPEAELGRRIEGDSRAEFGKLRSLDLYRSLRDEGAFVLPQLPDSGLTIGTLDTSPKESARYIIEHFGLPTLR